MVLLLRFACLSIVLCVFATTVRATLIVDNFDRPEGSAIVGSVTTVGGATWEDSTQYSGQSLVVNAFEQATNNLGSAAVNFVTIPELAEDETLVLELDMSVQSASWVRIIIGDNLDDMWDSDGWQFFAGITKSGATRELALQTRNDGAVTNTTPTFSTLPDIDMHHFTLTYDRGADQISLMVDSFVVADNYLLANDYTIHDIGVFTQNSSIIDNLYIEVVPEPASIGLVLLGMTMLLVRRAG